MISVLEKIIDEYIERKTSFSKIKELINSKLYSSMIVKFEFMLEAFYLFSTVKFGGTLTSLIQNYKQVIIAREASVYTITFLLALALFLLIVIPLQKKLEYFNSSIFVFPFQLIDENPHMKLVMKKVEKNKRLH